MSDISFSCVCNDCGKDVDARTSSDRDGNIEIRISPCEKCLELAVDMAKNEMGE